MFHIFLYALPLLELLVVCLHTPFFTWMGLETTLAGGMKTPSPLNPQRLKKTRWVYIIEGIFSVLVAFVVWFGLPNDPSNAYFLNAEEKELMRIRAIQRQAYMGSEEFDWNEIKLALVDPKVYLR